MTLDGFKAKPSSWNPMYKDIQDAEVFTRLVDIIIQKDVIFGYDIETGYDGKPQAGLALKTNHPLFKVVGFSLAFDENSAWYIPLAHDDETQNVDDPTQVVKDLWRLLQTGKSVPFNAGFELKGTGRLFRDYLSEDPEYGPLIAEDFGIFPVAADAQLLGFVSDIFYGERLTSKEGKEGEGARVGKDLKSIIEKAYNHKMTHFDDLFVGMGLKAKSHARFNMLPVSQDVIEYACEDSLWCLKLYKDIRTRLEDEQQEYPYDDRAYQLEMELLPVVARMDQVGLPLDWEYLQKKLIEAEELKDEMNEELQNEIAELLGETEVLNINFASPKQVAHILYDRLEIPRPIERGKKTDSTAEKALQSISKAHPIVRKILVYRTVVKMIGSYLKKYLTDLNYRGDGRAYPSHNQTGAISGRFSVDGMSYQQLPKPYHYKLKNGREFHMAFREIIVAPENHRIVGYDYSQIQLRMMAGFAQEDTMLQAFKNGTDIHTATASAMLKIPVDKVTSKDRAVGKALANSEVVLTPSGWIPMGEVKKGMVVVVPNGGVAEVSHVFPQGIRKIYKVTFEDGTVVRADGDHRWTVKDIWSHTSRVLTTNEIASAGLEYNAGRNKKTWKWYIENVEPLSFEGSSQLEVDPYLLGLLIGDGSLSAPAVAISIGEQDWEEITTYVESSIEGTGVHLRRNPKGYVFSSGTPGAYRNQLDLELKNLGLRGSKTQFEGKFGVRAWEKFIPQEYLFSSIEQRYSILRGLMDADGTVGADGRALLTTTSKQLAEDAMFIARSLGGRAKITRSRNTSFTYKGDKKLGRLSYEVLISTPEVPFRLRRKADKWLNIRSNKEIRLQDKKIISIEEDGFEQATCITVDDPGHEFITGGVTRTHNTLNFSIVFGKGADGLAEALTSPEDPVTVADAELLLQQYNAGYPKLAAWMSQAQRDAINGYVYGLLDRRYCIWEYKSDFPSERNKGDRTAVNEPIQGAEAIYMKQAMINADRVIREAGLEDKIKMVIMVHDALEFYVHDSISTQEVIDLLSPAVTYEIPGHPDFPEMEADWHEGPNLGALVEIELDENKKIKNYSMKMEVSGSPTVEWEASTFDEVFDQYTHWRYNVHPEYNSEPVVIEEEIQEPKQFELLLKKSPEKDELDRLKEFLENLEGENEIVLLLGPNRLPLPWKTSADLRHQANFNLILGGVTMYEVTPESIIEPEEHPF